MRNVSLFLVGTISAVSLTAGSALAEPSYSPVGCITQGNGNADTGLRHTSSFTGNDSAADLTVLCPIVKNESYDGLQVYGATARVIDRDVDDQVLCTLESRTKTGLSGGFAFASDGTGDNFADSATAELAFGFVHSFARGFYTLSCHVPSKNAANERSGIVSYQVPEIPLI